MLGQWLGVFETPQYSGRMIVNVDELVDHFGGVAFFIPNNQKFPTLFLEFATPNKAQSFSLTLNTIAAINPVTRDPWSEQNLKELFPGIYIPKEALVNVDFTDSVLRISARTETRFEISAQLKKELYTTESSIAGEVKTWDDFKKYASGVIGKRYLFRGQKKPWKLRTTFHRSRRYNLKRFRDEDIRALHRTLTARLTRVFDLNVPDENGAFLNLVRHHGYPTPLIDWTYSPFVAAFFAFREVRKRPNEDGVVRIYVFDQDSWKRDIPQFPFLDPAFLNLTFMEFLAIENERAVPQQAASILTNVDDVEAYIKEFELQKKKDYLFAIYIPSSERNTVMQELLYMGISSGSLFPGVDGTCEEYRERFFDW